MRTALPVALLALLVLGAALPAQPDEKKKRPRVQDRPVKQLRDHVRAYLKDERKQAARRPYEEKLELDADRLTWHETRPVILWSIQPRRGVVLTNEERTNLQLDIQAKLMPDIIFQYEGGLFFDGKEGSPSFSVAVAPPSATPPKAKERPPETGTGRDPAAERPRQERRYVWRFVPGPCCGSGAWYYLAEAPAASSAEGSARRPASERAGREDDTSFVSLEAGRTVNGAGSMSRTARLDLSSRAKKGPLDVKNMKAEHAPALYWAGYNLYRKRDYAEAFLYFEAATKLADEDARYWYYRALSERALGKDVSARQSARRAGELHRQGKPRADVVGLALEQVQGPLRLWLREAGKGSDTVMSR